VSNKYRPPKQVSRALADNDAALSTLAWNSKAVTCWSTQWITYLFTYLLLWSGVDARSSAESCTSDVGFSNGQTGQFSRGLHTFHGKTESWKCTVLDSYDSSWLSTCLFVFC